MTYLSNTPALPCPPNTYQTDESVGRRQSSYNYVKGGSVLTDAKTAFGTYLVRILSNGTRMPVDMLAHTWRYASSSFFYNQSFNVAYLSSYNTTSYSGQKHVFRIRLTVLQLHFGGQQHSAALHHSLCPCQHELHPAATIPHWDASKHVSRWNQFRLCCDGASNQRHLLLRVFHTGCESVCAQVGVLSMSALCMPLCWHALTLQIRNPDSITSRLRRIQTRSRRQREQERSSTRSQMYLFTG